MIALSAKSASSSKVINLQSTAITDQTQGWCSALCVFGGSFDGVVCCVADSNNSANRTRTHIRPSLWQASAVVQSYATNCSINDRNSCWYCRRPLNRTRCFLCQANTVIYIFVSGQKVTKRWSCWKCKTSPACVNDAKQLPARTLHVRQTDTNANSQVEDRVVVGIQVRWIQCKCVLETLDRTLLNTLGSSVQRVPRVHLGEHDASPQPSLLTSSMCADRQNRAKCCEK